MSKSEGTQTSSHVAMKKILAKIRWPWVAVGIVALVGGSLADWLFALAGLVSVGCKSVTPVGSSAQGAVITAAVGILGGTVSMLIFLVNYDQKNKHFVEQQQTQKGIADDQRAQDKAQFDLSRQQERDETEQRRLDERFTDIQDRITSSNTGERVNAVHSLIDIAKTKRPGARDQLRPSEDANPFFKPAVRRIASLLVLEDEDVVRSAALAAVKPLIEFSRQEYLAIGDQPPVEWEAFDQTLTRFLIETLAEANRNAYQCWVESFARFYGTACQGDSRAVVNSAHNWLFAVPPNIPNDELAEMLEHQHVDTLGQNPSHIWRSVESACSFLWPTVTPHPATTRLRDILIFASGSQVFKSIVSEMTNHSFDEESYEAMHAVNLRSMRERARKLVATRDALALSISNRHLDQSSIPSDLKIDPDNRPDRHVRSTGLRISPACRAKLQIDIHNCFLAGSNLHGLHLPLALANGCNLISANLYCSTLVQCFLCFAKCSGANFGLTEFDHCSLNASDFYSADFNGSALYWSTTGTENFEYSDLRNITFKGIGDDRFSIDRAKISIENLQNSADESKRILGFSEDRVKSCWLYDDETVIREPLPRTSNLHPGEESDL